MARTRLAPRPRLLPLLALLALLAPRARAWDSGDLELFDLVEEVPRNFYDFLGVQQCSSGKCVEKTRRCTEAVERKSLCNLFLVTEEGRKN